MAGSQKRKPKRATPVSIADAMSRLDFMLKAIESETRTAKLNSVEPHAYLADVIARIVSGHPNSRIDELLPWTYPAQAALRDAA